MNMTKKSGLYPGTVFQQYFAFNVWDVGSAQAVLDGAAEAGHDVILQTSTKAFTRLDRETFRAFVTQYAQRSGLSAHLHLDHCRDIGQIREAVRCGWDSVMLDVSDRPLEENIRLTNEVYAIAAERGVLVEAEVGQIRGAEEGAPAAEGGVARSEDVKVFLRSARVDMLAVAIGTAHGIYCGTPTLHYGLIEEIGKISDIPLVIHGGTGLSEEVLLRLLSYENVRKINISTDVKQAFRRGIVVSAQKGYLEETGFDPLRVMEEIHDSVEKMTADKLKLLRR